MTFAPKPPEPTSTPSATVVDMFPAETVLAQAAKHSAKTGEPRRTQADLDVAVAAYKALPVGSKERMAATEAAMALSREIYGVAQFAFPVAAPTPAPAAPAPTPAASVIGHQLNIPSSVDPLLVKILSWPRNHETVSEVQFCAFLQEHIRALNYPIRMHQVGSFSVTVPRTTTSDGVTVEGFSTTLFSCHVDTVDTTFAPDVRKKLNYDDSFGLIGLEKDSLGTCLGADDGAGVWIMVKMIEAGVPGTYMFHRGEEKGGISAKANASEEAAFLERFECAVAFDRPRDNEVITHQGGVRCASEKFAVALAKAFNDNGPFEYKPSSSGVYTDTKEYRHIIPECVNLGVGYTSQHGRQEELDYGHLVAMLDACLKIKWDALPIDRDPKVVETSYSTGWGGRAYNDFGDRSFGSFDDDDLNGWKKVNGVWQWVGHEAPALGSAKRETSKTQTKGKTTKGKTKPQARDLKRDTAAVDAPHVSVSRADRAELVAAACSMQVDEIRDMVWNNYDEAVELIVALLRENASLNAEVDQLDALLGGQ